MQNLRKLTPRSLGQAVFNSPPTYLPSLLSNRLEIRFLRNLGADVALSPKLGNHVKILGPAGLVIEDGAAIANKTVLDARGGLHLQRRALYGFESITLTYTHTTPDLGRPVHHQGVVFRHITIGENCWVGARCIVLPGGSGGGRSIVGASAVVSRPVPADSIVVDNPANVVNSR